MTSHRELGGTTEGRHNTRRYRRVDEVAASVAFRRRTGVLYITGANLTVDGGINAREGS